MINIQLQTWKHRRFNSSSKKHADVYVQLDTKTVVRGGENKTRKQNGPIKWCFSVIIYICHIMDMPVSYTKLNDEIKTFVLWFFFVVRRHTHHKINTRKKLHVDESSPFRQTFFLQTHFWIAYNSKRVKVWNMVSYNAVIIFSIANPIKNNT